MPIYEYACPHCHKTFEEWLRSSDDQARSFPCPQCGQDAQRILSQTTFILKGGGWYVTEYGGHGEDPEGTSQAENAAQAAAPAQDAPQSAGKDVPKDVPKDTANAASTTEKAASAAPAPAPAAPASSTPPPASTTSASPAASA